MQSVCVVAVYTVCNKYGLCRLMCKCYIADMSCIFVLWWTHLYVDAAVVLARYVLVWICVCVCVGLCFLLFSNCMFRQFIRPSSGTGYKYMKYSCATEGALFCGTIVFHVLVVNNNIRTYSVCVHWTVSDWLTQQGDIAQLFCFRFLFDMFMSYGWGSTGENVTSERPTRALHDVTSERYTTWRQICPTKDKISLNGSFTRMRILPRAYRNTITRIRFDASGYFSSSAIPLCASGHVSYLNENYVVPCICLRAIWHMHGSMWRATLE